MVVKITAEHINEGKPGTAMLCAVALALQDAGCIHPAVFWTEACFTDEFGHEVTVSLPERVGKFIEDFDNEAAVSPMEFEIDLKG